MTVREVKKSVVTCDWHEGNKTRRESYYAEQLVSAEREMDVVEVARRIAFILNSAAHKKGLTVEPGDLNEFLDALSKDDQSE